jgi:hypothetical protein
MLVGMHRRTVLVLVLVSLALAGVACKKEGGNAAASKYPGTDDGAKQLLSDLQTAKDPRALTRELEPSSADYKAVFTAEAAARAEEGYKKLWSDPQVLIAAPAANPELLLTKATTDDMKQWTKQVEADFPGGYKRIADKFQPGLTVYRWKYVKPGEKSGMAFDGLIFVNNHWTWFPKPWRVFGGDGKE